jgi:hypothetical protein
LHSHSDRADLLSSQPDAWSTDPCFGRDIEASQGPYHCLLEQPNVVSDAEAATMQVQYGVTDYLTWTMKCHVASAITFNNFGAARIYFGKAQ